MSYQKAMEGWSIRSHAPYSKFRVGAHLEASGMEYIAGNVESGGSSNSICAERLVIAQALMRGVKPTHIHLVTNNDNPTAPCGTCLQFMSDYPDLKITMYSFNGKESITKTLDELLPMRYKRT